MTAVLDALATTLATWTLLLVAGISAEPWGPERAVFGSFLLATALLLATRKPDAGRRTPPGCWLLGLLSGFAAYPLWTGVIGCVGLSIGLAAEPIQTRPEGWLTWLAVLGLGPVFEELLYRERLQNAFAQVPLPGFARVVLASLLFAVSHVHPWAVLGTLLVGLALGFTYEWTHCLGFCIALHAGLNLASVLPPPSDRELDLGLLASAAFAWGLRVARSTRKGMGHAVAPA
ncbi:MAG: CPBP family intramembrane metalloprotease [bacterium]|nr:CPBP family intramembrane metalloprotease [bacterium]